MAGTPTGRAANTATAPAAPAGGEKAAIDKPAGNKAAN